MFSVSLWQNVFFLTPGTKLGCYEILAPLGAGGMGEVYRARDTKLNRDVAIKVLPAELAHDPERLVRFEREAQVLASLNHPNIAQIYGVEESSGTRALVMELVEGRTLDQVIPQSGLAPEQFFAIALSLADALHAAHQKHVTHRDLKPANVMVTGDGRVKVLDFGLARVVAPDAASEAGNSDEGATRMELTRAGTIVGTWPYMSPEQIDARPLDHRSDIFSLGILLYEMATGRRPFQGDSNVSLMISIMRDHPRPVSDLRGDIPAHVSQVIARCLTKSPSDRIQSAQEILLELKAQRSASSGSAVAGSRSSTTATASSADLRIAVLPFASRGKNADAEALAEGLSEDITAGLARFSYLRVVEQGDAGKSSARYVVEGSLRAAGATVRINVWLLDKESETRLWSETYDRTLTAEGLFELQDDITSRVVVAIADQNGVLVRSMAGALKYRVAAELPVDDLVILHFAHLQQMRLEESAALRDALEKALEREPNHALGWACLAWFYGGLLWRKKTPEAMERQRRASERSIEADPRCEMGWLTMAMGGLFRRDAAGFRLAAERALALNPLNSTVVAYVAQFLCGVSGEWERGMELNRRIREIHPQHSGWYHFTPVWYYYRAGDLEKALLHAKQINMPSMAMSQLWLASIAARLGRAADVHAALENVKRTEPALLDPDVARDRVSAFLWDEAELQGFMDGFMKAQALADAAPEPVAREKPVPGSNASIAVLPFADMSEAKDQEWFCDGIAEEILNALTHLRGLNVAARASAFSFRGKSGDLREIAEKLHVKTVLSGSVRRAGNRVRITVELTLISNGYRLWSERYDRELEDIFDVQDQIARAVAEHLRVTLAGEAEARLVPKATENMSAYQLYLKGRAFLYRRGAGTGQALESFKKAVDLDPGYGLAWVGISDVYAVLSYYGVISASEAREQIFGAVRRAVALAPDAAETHLAVAHQSLLLELDVARSEREFLRALEINPVYVQARCWYGVILLQWVCGRSEEGLRQARRALEDDPLSAYAYAILALSLYTARRSEEGVEAARAAVKLDPSTFLGHLALGCCLASAGRTEEAIAVYEHALAMSGRSPMIVQNLARLFAGCGRHAEAESLYQELLQRAASGNVANSLLAPAALAAGHNDEAMDFAQRAWKEREPSFLLFARVFPDYDGLRQQPWFAEIFREYVGIIDSGKRS